MKVDKTNYKTLKSIKNVREKKVFWRNRKNKKNK